MWKKTILCVSLTLLGLVHLPAFGRDIVVRFAKGSYCGSYVGRINPGDTFSLRLGKDQFLEITAPPEVDYSVINPRGGIISGSNPSSPPQVRLFQTGKQAGVFKVRINRVPYPEGNSFQFCAY
ncbi:MAG: hypothetical protein N3D76_12635 [Geminocystis sp.]|nr:hypothetical protein [Geminocystis sp.]HIK36880.1 hypothetical protein [Geminocystis sp. M7585_C2015_104]